MHHSEFQYCSISELGHARSNNEDVFLEMPDHGFFALADGMGGHNAGEIAAKEAILNLSQAIKKLSLANYATLHPLISQMQKAVCSANSWVHKLSKQSKELQGMGTTLSCFLLHKENLLFAHVGDSRLYRYRHTLTQLTEDHSLRNELLKSGELKLEHAHDFPKKNIVTRAIGTQNEVLPEMGIDRCQPGDIYFLCSDGLSDYLTDQEMEIVFFKNAPIFDTMHELVHLALQKGGKDNITMVIVKVLS